MRAEDVGIRTKQEEEEGEKKSAIRVSYSVMYDDRSMRCIRNQND